MYALHRTDSAGIRHNYRIYPVRAASMKLTMFKYTCVCAYKIKHAFQGCIPDIMLFIMKGFLNIHFILRRVCHGTRGGRRA